MVVVESTDLFVGSLQVVRVRAPDHEGPVHVHVEGAGVRSARHGTDLEPGLFDYEVPVDVSAHPPGTVLPARAVVRHGEEHHEVDFELTVAEPGRTLHLVAQATAVAEVRAHLELALADPAYRFGLLASVVEPYLDTRPQDREPLTALVDQNRVELVDRLLPANSAPVEDAETLADAERAAYRQLSTGQAALVGGGRWFTQIHHDWNSRYSSPRFVCSLPQDVPVPQGVEVRVATRVVEEAEAFASLVAEPPEDVLAHARARLADDADPLVSLREAHFLATEVRERVLRALSSIVDTSGDGVPVVVWNPLPRKRSGMVEVRLEDDLADVSVVSADGLHPCVHEGHTVVFHAGDVPALGWKVFHLAGGTSQGWTRGGGAQIANSAHLLTVDPARGGVVTGLVRLVDEAELLAPAVGNDLGATTPGTVTVWHSPVGERVVVRGRTGGVAYAQTVTLWEGVDWVDCVTSVDDLRDEVRITWPGVEEVLRPVDFPQQQAVEYAVPCGDPARAAEECAHPLTAVLGVDGSGRLPASGSLDEPVDVGPVVVSSEHDVPLFADHLRHERGPALGRPPVGVRFRGDGEVVVTSSAEEELAGRVRLVAPPGWSVAPAEVPFTLPPGGSARSEVSIGWPRWAAPGLYPVRAQVDAGPAEAGPVEAGPVEAGPVEAGPVEAGPVEAGPVEAGPVEAGPVVEDVLLVDVPEWGGSLLEDGPVQPLWIARAPEPLRLRPGERAVVPVAVASALWAPVAVEVRLVSPWGTWDFVRPLARGGEVPTRGRAEFGFEVVVPRWATTGRWWLRAKVAGAGLVRRSAAVPLEVVD
ncbi:NEW3 domain-containing protein [Actinosynnema sp. CA-248983]